MNMQAALTTLGITGATLSDGEKRQLDEIGYLPLPDLIPQTLVAAMLARFQELVREEGDAAGLEVHQEAGTQRLANLVDKDPLFEVCFTHPRVLAAMNYVLKGDFKLSSLNGRASLPGAGNQPFHTDWGEAVAPDSYEVCNSIWLLVDFTEANGATRVVPGSHLAGRQPQEAMDDPAAPHPDEILLTGKAGTVVVFNSHLWHGGTTNRTDSPRYALHSYFTRRKHKPQTDLQSLVGEATRARLRPEARFILDV